MSALPMAHRIAATLLLLVLGLGLPAGAAEPEPELSPELREAYAAYQQAVAARLYADAHRYARQALELAERELPANDPRTATLSYNLGAISLRLERFSDAISQLEVAVKRYRAAFGKYAEESVLPMRRLGTAYMELEQWAPAERIQVRAISAIERSRGRDDPEIADILYLLVTVAERLKEPQRVKTYGRRAINIYEQSEGDHRVEIGVLHLALARNEIELGDFSTSKKHMGEASELLEESLPLGHPQLIALYRFMADAYKAAGMGNRAHKYRKKLEENEQAAAARG